MKKQQEKTVKQLRQEKRDREALERAKQRKQEEAATAEVKTKLFSPLSIVIIAGALILAITMCVVAGFLLAEARNPYRHDSMPIAVIKMSDGKQMVFELYYDEAPIAVTVFHYYAHHGYYNGTIIDSIPPAATSDSLKMGGYTTSLIYEGTRPKMFEANSPYNNSNFTFYAKEDASNLGSPDEVGTLSTIKLAYGPSAEFQIGASKYNMGEGASAGKVFGRAYDEETLAVIRGYTILDKVQPENIKVSNAGIVRITSIKFYNNEKLMDHLDMNTDFRNTFLTGTTREYSVNV